MCGTKQVLKIIAFANTALKSGFKCSFIGINSAFAPICFTFGPCLDGAHYVFSYLLVFPLFLADKTDDCLISQILMAKKKVPNSRRTNSEE